MKAMDTAAAGRVSRVRCRYRRRVAGAGPAAGMQLLRLHATARSIINYLQAARDELAQICQRIDVVAKAVDDFNDPDKADIRKQIKKAARSSITECRALIRDHFSPSSTIDRPLNMVKAAVDDVLSTGPLDPIWLLLPPELIDSTLDIVQFVFGRLQQVRRCSHEADIGVACLSHELPKKEHFRLEIFSDNNMLKRMKTYAHGSLARIDRCLQFMPAILEKLEQPPPEVRQFFTLGE